MVTRKSKVKQSARERLETVRDTVSMVNQQFEEELARIISGVPSSSSATEEDFESPKSILGERKQQRQVILWFSIWVAGVSVAVILLIVIAQALLNIFYEPPVELLSTGVLQVLAVSVFGTVVGVINIIAKSIWDDSNYMGFFTKKKGDN